ncbi:MAG: 6-bladed beta-propeller [Acidobacteriota bacterium]|nr:6-bladed beta-propeller [Acidobacteriota bacterium]
MILFFLILSCSDHAWEIPNTGVFSPVLPTQVDVSASGELFLADIHEHRIIHYDKCGKRLPDIGGKGQGPGEFSVRILALQYYDRFLYAFELMDRNIKVYDVDGSFLKTIRTPYTFRNPLQPAFKLSEGWLVFHQGSLLHLADDFQVISLLAEEKKESQRENSQDSRPFNPARDQPRFTVSQEGDKVLFYAPGRGFEIRAYDVSKRTVATMFVIDSPKYPFTESWGLEKLEARSKTNSILNQSGWHPDFPEFFPDILDLKLDFEGYLHITRGVALVKPGIPKLVLSQTGKPVDDHIPSDRLVDVLADDGKWLYVADYQNDELGIRKVKRETFRQGLRAHDSR